MKGVVGHASMQVVMLALLKTKLFMSKAMTSGTASTMESSQITTIFTAVTVGTPLCFTRDQDATARYLRSKGMLIFQCSSLYVKRPSIHPSIFNTSFLLNS